jgi:Protein of unknown function (DUF4089)
MDEKRFDADAFIDAAAPLVGLTIDEASRPLVKAHLEFASDMAALLFQERLDDQQEPAPVFAP